MVEPVTGEHDVEVGRLGSLRRDDRRDDGPTVRPHHRYAERAAWKVGWRSYREGRDAETVSYFERAAADFPRSDYRPAWLYWSGRAHERMKAASTARARFELTAADYLNSYYGRLAVKRLDGRTRGRAAKVARFQDDARCPVFLISLKAGGFGLNLTAADYVFLLDPWWNPAAELQAIDRAHRIGQKRAVHAYRLVCRDTVEERVLELQAQKRALYEAILGNERSLLQKLTRADLEVLLR